MTEYLESLFGLAGKRAVVTGAGRGLGKAMAAALASAGAEVVLCARGVAELEATARELSAAGATTLARPLDVSDEDAVRALFDEIGPVDIVVHSAAVYEKSSVLELTGDAWRATTGTNLGGAFYVCSAAARVMAAHGVAGSIVLVASVQAFQALPNRVAYAASKSGMLQLARSFAYELGDRGIRVNCVLPGFFHTESNVERYRDPVFAGKIAAQVPLGRGGDGYELASAVLYFASSASSYTTGTTLVVDGGLTAGLAL